MIKYTAFMIPATRRFIALTVILTVGFVSSYYQAIAQCDVDNFVDECASSLGEDFAFLRSFEAEEIKGSTNYPYTGAFLFRKGINYVFTSCPGEEDGPKIVVNLYNRTRKLVATTYNKETDKYYSKMIFKCSATGIFFVQTLMPLGENNCGLTMLGFDAQ